MQALVIDNNAGKSIRRLVRYAESHPLSLYQLKKIIEGVSPPPGDDARFCIQLERGFRCVFTIEEHRNNTICRHLSVSVDKRGHYPSVRAVGVLMELFGFAHDRPMRQYCEEEVEAVNIIQEIE